VARIIVFAPLPPSRSPLARSGKALVKLLKRALRGRHDVRGMWPVPESVQAVLRTLDLPVYFLANSPEEREIYQVAMEHPGLVVLGDLSLERVVQMLVRGRDPLGFAARREAERLQEELVGNDVDPDVAWSASAARRARGVVVHSDEHRSALRAIGCRTPTYVAPPPVAGDARVYVQAVEDTLRLVLDPLEWTLARWTAALVDAGVTPDRLDEEHGLRYAAALEEIRTSPAGEP
jgi:hypothetical protein